jgi:signal transduction histidine kinase/CheY-like chemotaxis protein
LSQREQTRAVHVSRERQPYSAEQLLEALEKAPAYIAVLRGPDFVYEFLNDEMAAVVGFDDPIGKPFGGSHHARVPELREALQRVWDTGEPWSSPDLPFELRHPDGSREVRYFDVHFQPLRRGDAVDGVLIHSFDVTPLVQAQQRLAQIQKVESLGVLAGGVAHDFNNMLGAIMGNVSAAAAMLRVDDPARPLLAAALDGVRRAADLTRQLLTYAGKARAETRPIDLTAHVREIADLLETTLPRKVSLKLELEGDLPAIDADPTQLQQVVMNLLINAGEAIGDARGHVVVSTGVEPAGSGGPSAPLLAPTDEPRPDGYVFVEVRDDGRGMDEATQLRMFDPFFTTKAKGAATHGLGLAAVLGIVRAHGGAIRVHSAPGLGTRFRVLFPPSSRLARASRSAPPESGWRGSGVVLVVDDDAGVRTATSQLLALLGFQPVDAPDGPAALRALAARPDVRLVVLDMTMPEMSGEEVFREVRRTRPDLPVVFTSGYDDDEARGRFGPEQRASFLAKPYTLSELSGTLRDVLEPPTGG